MKRKILFIINSLSAGGAERVLIDLLANFDYTRYRVTLLLYVNRGELMPRLNSNVETISLLPDFKVPTLKDKICYHIKPLRRFGINRGIRRMTEKALEGRTFDTIVSFVEGFPLFIHNMITSKGRRNISWVHTDLTRLQVSKNNFYNDMQEHQAYGRMDCIVCVSKAAEKAFRKVHGQWQQNVVTIYNIIDKDFIRRKALERKIAKEGFTIAIVGRLDLPKRHDRMLHTIKLLKHRGLDIHLWIIGQGDLDASLRKLSADLGLDNNVDFKGFQPNPYPYIKCADLIAMSSDTEGYPLAIAESLCLGKAIVSTRVTGSTEMLADDAGILTDLSAESLADGIMRVASNPQLRLQLEKGAEERSKIFNVGKVLQEVYGIL